LEHGLLFTGLEDTVVVLNLNWDISLYGLPINDYLKEKRIPQTEKQCMYPENIKTPTPIIHPTDSLIRLP